jgi:site-specific recombinase XerD
VVDCGMMEGKRIRYAFKTREEAEGKATLVRVQRKNEGESSFIPLKFDRVDAQAALEILKPHGLTLREAAKFYVNNISIIRDSKPIQIVVEELLKAKAQDGRRPRYLKELASKLKNGFAAEFGPQPIHEITHQDLDAWLRSHDDWSPLTRNSYATVLSTLFSFAAKRGLVLKNPALRLDRAKIEFAKPGILSVYEARALLKAASPFFGPALALCLFAGLRPEAELWHLDWKGIDLKERLIDIWVSKNTASHRFVKISDNLLVWLKRYQKDSGTVCPAKRAYYYHLEKTREQAKEALQKANLPHPSLERWPQDVMRHTFASMHYAAFKHAAETAEQMGHAGGLRIFFRHYRNRVKPAEAAAFWRLSPKV